MTIKITRGLLGLFFAALLLTAIPAQSDPVSTAMAGQSIHSVVDNLKSSINDIVNNLDSVIDKRSFDIRTHLLVVLQNLEYISDTIGDKLFEHVSREQQTFLVNSKVILEKFRAGNLDQIAALRALAGDMESALAVLPLSNRFPIVKEYSPSYVPISGSTNFAIQIGGSWLGNGEPTLEFPLGSCKRITKIDRRLEFDCPKSIFAEESVAPRKVTGQLQVVGEMSLWEKIKSYVSGAEKVRKYDLAIAVIPASMGSVEGTAVVKVRKSEPKARREPYDWYNAHCDGNRNPCETFNQTNANWKIDVTSIKDHCSHSSRSSCAGTRNVTEASFQVCGAVRNSGECTRVLGKIVARDGRGHVWGYVTWTENRAIEVNEPQSIGQRTLKWGSDESYQLPDDSIAYSLTVSQLDGKKIVADQTGDYGWFEVSHNPASNLLVIRPKQLDAALR